MKLYISALAQDRELKFTSYVHLPSINQIFKYRFFLQCCNVGDVFYIFEQGLYISALEQDRILILNNYALLEFINTIYKYCYA